MILVIWNQAADTFAFWWLLLWKVYEVYGSASF